MDPNANLRMQADATEVDELRELREALYRWLAGGGFSPDWSSYPIAARNYFSWAAARGGK